MIRVNMDKARQIAHEMRRYAREQEFKPYDEAIAKQIPGQMDGAEAARQQIRQKYADIQIKVDAASSPEELKAALGI